MILPGWPGDRRAEKEEIRAVAVGEHRADLGNPRHDAERTQRAVPYLTWLSWSVDSTTRLIGFGS
jgi:hypothetical protein